MKKKVFYNVTIHSFLEYPDIFERLHYVFDYFKGSDKYILWWRPHPLLKETLYEQNIEVYKKFLQIEKYYIDNNVGILDYSNEFQIAIDDTDIYYGDYGGAADEFRRTGKPMVYSIYEKNFFPIGMCEYNGVLFATDHDNSNIMTFDTFQKEWKVEKAIINYSNESKCFHKSVSYNNKIYFIPFMARDLAIYDIKTKEVELISIPRRNDLMSSKKTMFWINKIWNDRLYMFPAGYPILMFMDIQTKEITELCDLSDYFRGDEFVSLISIADSDDEFVYLCSCIKNEVYKINLITGEFKVFEIGDSKTRFTDIRKYEDCFFLVVKNRPEIIKWNPITNECKYYKTFPSNFEYYDNDKISIFNDAATVLFQNDLFCMPAKCNMSIVLNVKTGIINKIEVFDKYARIEHDNMNVSATDTVAVVYNENSIYLQTNRNRFIKYNYLKNEVDEYSLNLSLKEAINREICILNELFIED